LKAPFFFAVHENKNYTLSVIKLYKHKKLCIKFKKALDFSFVYDKLNTERQKGVQLWKG